MKKIILLIFCFNIFICYGETKDTLNCIKLKREIENLENQVKEVRRDQLNYSVEKNLLKETYSSNYEQTNQVITIILGIIGLFGYLGLRDINSIKKEYKAELERLNKLKSDLEQKINSISNTQIKYEKEVAEIIAQNEEQNTKIKLLELNQKIKKLSVEKKYPAALENCLIALQLDPNNIPILLHKALIYTFTRSYGDAIETYKKIIELDPKNDTPIMNLAEVYIFTKQHDKSQKIIDSNSDIFNTLNGEHAMIIFNALKLYNGKFTKELKEEIKAQVGKNDLKSKTEILTFWGLREAITYIDSEKDSVEKEIMENYILYLQGKLTGEDLIKVIDSQP